MSNAWVLFSSVLLGCVILEDQIRGAVSFPMSYGTDYGRSVNAPMPSKKLSFVLPKTWGDQWKRSTDKRDYTFSLPGSWGTSYKKRRDYSFSLPGVWSHTKNPTPGGWMGFKKRSGGEDGADAGPPLDLPLIDLTTCDDVAKLTDSLKSVQDTLIQMQDDCVTKEIPLELCLSPQENYLIEELYETAKRGAEQLGWCLVYNGQKHTDQSSLS